MCLSACLAPSVNNSQPWYFRLPTDDRIELYADRERQLTGRITGQIAHVVVRQLVTEHEADLLF